jgi:hypothetical protein
MPGSNSTVRGGQYGEKETSVSRAELRQLQNSLVEAMEKMFDERLPLVRGRTKQHSSANSRRGLFGHSGQHGGGAHGHSIRPRVLIDDEDYYVSPKRKIQQECHQPKLSERNQKEKMRHSTIREKEWHQPKFSERVQNKKMRDSTIFEESHKTLCESDPQKLREKRDESCEELFTSNIIIPSILVPFAMQVHEENDVVNYDQPPIFDEEEQVIVNDNDTHAYVASQDVEVIVHQNLYENESHIAKMRESENKGELSDSTHYKVESVNNESVRDTLQKNRYLECRPSEDIFETNTLISTSSFVFPNVQVGDENREEMDAQDNTILVERNEKVAIQLNPLCVAQNLNHDMDNGNISEVQSLVLAPPKSL